MYQVLKLISQSIGIWIAKKKGGGGGTTVLKKCISSCCQKSWIKLKEIHCKLIYVVPKILYCINIIFNFISIELYYFSQYKPGVEHTFYIINFCE